MRVPILIMLALGLSLPLAAPGQADEQPAAELQAKAETLMREAKAAKEAGREEEARGKFQRAEQMLRQVKAAAEGRESDQPREQAGERPDAERREGDRPREGAKERPDAERREGDRLREGMKERPDRPSRERDEGEDVEARQRLQNMRREIAELRRAGKAEEAAQLEREASELAQQVERRPVERRMAEMRMRLEELRRSGRMDEAERLEREVQGMVERAREREARGFEPGDRVRDEAFERRMRNLRMAADNLRAAGLEEQADMLLRQAERFRPGQGPPPRGEGDLARPLRDLHEAVRRLNERMDRLEQAVKRSMEERE